MADDHTQTTKPSSLRRLGTFLYDAARRVLETAGQRLKQRWSELRQPVRRGDAKTQTENQTPSSDVSQPAT